MIDLHYCATPNGEKVTIFLEEAELPFKPIVYNLFKGEHFTPEFRAINPNNKLPAIVDHEPRDGGPPFAVFESGAILLYLAEKTGKFLPVDPRRRSLAQQWLIWQMAGLGPMTGQASHFVRYAPEGQDYGVTRYTKEANRLLNVLEYRLRQVDYLAEEYSIADMVCFPWIQVIGLVGLDLGDRPAIRAWNDRIGERPAVARALASKKTAKPALYMQKRAVLNSDEWSNLFGERLHDAARID